MNLSKQLIISLSLAFLLACGGKGPSSNEPELEAAGGGTAEALPSEGATAANTEIALPSIPATPVAAPASLMAEVALSNPNSQLTQVGVFADAVQPGIGAFMTPMGLMQQLESMVGAVGIGGIDLNGPLFLVINDREQVALIATVSNEADLTQSLEGGSTQVILHDGFAAVGKAAALAEIAPYALSNLVKQPQVDEPSMVFHIANILNGSQGELIRGQILANVGNSGPEAAGAQALLDILGEVTTLRTTLEASQAGATLRVTAHVAPGGMLRAFIGKQRPSSFPVLARIGTGPWAFAAGGRLDLGFLAPMLVKLGEVEANPIVTQVAAQLATLNGEMGFALNMTPQREAVMAMELADAKGLGAILDMLMGMLSKQKDLNLEGMKVQLKMAAIKTRGGSLHEFKMKPTTPDLEAAYGKKGVSAFVGIASGSFVGSFGPNAKRHANTLVTAKGKIPGKGKKLAAVIELAKASKESLLLAQDVLSLKGDRAPMDIEPMVIGVGFTAETVAFRVVFPTPLVKEAISSF